MKLMPPKEIMKYISFKNGEPVAKENMPDKYKSLFDAYREKVINAKNKKRIYSKVYMIGYVTTNSR